GRAPAVAPGGAVAGGRTGDPAGTPGIHHGGGWVLKVLVVGSGGREHALVWKLAQSTRVTKVFCAPGNAGIATQAECVPIPATDLQSLRDFALAQQVDFTVVGPEAPLAAGIADVFRAAGLRIFGPSRAAARL